MTCAHPFRDAGLGGYAFDIPLLDGDHVTDEAGTGFVHTAPGHGREDFEIWMEYGRQLADRGIDTAIPFTVAADGKFTADAPGFEGASVITDKGKKGDANKKVIDALVQAECADRARAAEAPVSALVAVEEAGDLSQYAAVVRLHGQALRDGGT